MGERFLDAPPLRTRSTMATGGRGDNLIRGMLLRGFAGWSAVHVAGFLRHAVETERQDGTSDPW